MKNFTSLRKFVLPLVTVLIAIFTVSLLNAQVVRPYTNIYSDNIRGGHTIIGNTITAIYSSGSGSTGTVNTAQMNDFSTSGTGNYTNGRTSAFGNDNSNIQFVDVDGDNTTSGSSSANLILPAGTNTIKFARLYWGGRITGGTGGANNINLRTAKIKFNADSYQTITAAPGAIDKSLVTGSDSVYQTYFDVTSYVNTKGAGTYTIADIKAATGSIGSGGNFAGWALVVVYENLTLNFSSVRVYDGFLQVFNGGSATTQTITLSGLNPPTSFSLSSDAYMSTVAWEGDANLGASSGNPNGDFVKVNGTAASNAVNPVANFWNGTISKNGAHLSGNKNPDFKNQMGIDIDELEVGTGFGITPSTTNVSVQFGTEADQYFPSLFAFTMKTKPPLVQLDKTVKDSTAAGQPTNILHPNDILTYTIVGKNKGSGNALKCVITDTLPTFITYRPNSLRINAPTPGVTIGAQTDNNDVTDFAFKGTFGGKEYVKFFIGTGATSSIGGTLAPNDSFNVRFQSIVPSNSTVTFISNTARIVGTEQDGTTPFVDDGTAIIGPLQSPLPVKMTAFTVQKQNTDAILKWTTATETKNDHFEIERSLDGISFTKLGTVNGNGTTTETKNYQYSDPINTSATIIYYRLKVVDIDGKGTYSKIIALRVDGLITLKNFSVYPNPFTNNLKLQINSAKETSITIHLNSAAGLRESNYTITLEPGENIVVLSNLETLQSGIHLLEIISEDGRLTQKIIKR